MGVNARIERTWGLATTHTVVWPTGSMDTERLASACAEIAGSARPGSFVADRVAALASAEGVSSWRFLDRHRSRFVTTADHRSLDGFVAFLADRGHLGLPFSFVVCPGGFAVVHSHELGDGSVSTTLLDAVLRTYAGDRDTGPVPDRLARGRDIAVALGSLWTRRPRTVLETATGVVRRYRHRPAPETVATAVCSGVRHETWALTDTEVAALDRWRRTVPSRPSMSMALLWTVAGALAAHGYPGGVQPWQVVVGMRGEAPGLAGFGGNLVGRALLDVDPGGDPAVPTRQLRRQGASGEIVALHLAKLGTRALVDTAGRLRPSGGRPGAGPAVERIGTSPGLSWSDRGRHAYSPAFAAAIPAAGSPPHAYTFVTPGTSGIGVNVNWVDGRPGVLISFGACPLDDAAVDGVMRTLRGGATPQHAAAALDLPPAVPVSRAAG